MNDSIDRYTRISNKLNDSYISLKAYWSTFKMPLNNKKILIIPPLFYKNRFVTDYKKKTELFPLFFATECTAINNGRSLLSELLLKTDKFLSNITFSNDEMLKLIQNLDSVKKHGPERISIWMLKICKPFVFKSCLEIGIFPLEWRKANVVSVHNKMTNNL